MVFEKVKKSILTKLDEFKVCSKEKELSKSRSKVVSYQNRFPILPKLHYTVSILSVSSISDERGFSLMNLFKNNVKLLMELDSLNNLMFINKNVPLLKGFDLSKAMNKLKDIKHIMLLLKNLLPSIRFR